jgi:hypothetical protein
MPGKRPSVKNEKLRRPQEEGDVQGARGEDRRLTWILEPWGEAIRLGLELRQRGTSAQKKAAGRQGGKASARS